ncbi:oligosaccharide flippase family protein [Leisingera sp. ANG-S5]|uniref:oligosaccharide flippase family protein n=1 Tax=Leisingera sp. ANG-S5 TaxID=1577901 RepID=UPI00057C7630|nr:oligosaccharide flippase family protein [Leisingera sp. ANG-S5]KIC28699.1 hypothetical protein RA25_21015 [Leisingera sp. ANG-S5]
MSGSKVKGQALWSVLLQFSRFGGNAVVFLAMARFLTIEQIGAFGMAYAPIRWTQGIYKTGIAHAVVVSLRQPSTAGNAVAQRAFTALFWIALMASAGVIAVVVLIAAALAQWHGSSQPVPQMMLALLLVPVSFGLASVPEGLLQKNLQIKVLALRTLFVQLTAAAAAVLLALAGAGAWALAGFAIVNALLSSAVSIIKAGWRPSGGPDLSEIRRQLPQAGAITGRMLVAGTTLPLMQFTIGLVIGLEASGAFQIAQRVYQILDALCLAPIRFLVLPLFAKARETGTLSGEPVLRGLRMTGVISAPFYLGTLIISGPALTLVVGTQNAPSSVPLLQILCLMGINISSVTILTQAATAAGRAELAFQRALWTLGTAGLLLGPALLLGTWAVAASLVAAAYSALLFYYIRLHPVFDISPRQMFAAVAQPYLAGLLAVSPLAWLVIQAEADGWLVLPAIIGTWMLYAALLPLVAPAAWQETAGALRRKRRD